MLLMERCGWPAIPYDGQLLVSHQERASNRWKGAGALRLRRSCALHLSRFFASAAPPKMCIEMCFGTGHRARSRRRPRLDREKCVHCGACLWNCGTPLDDEPPARQHLFRPRRRRTPLHRELRSYVAQTLSLPGPTRRPLGPRCTRTRPDESGRGRHECLRYVIRRLPLLACAKLQIAADGSNSFAGAPVRHLE